MPFGSDAIFSELLRRELLKIYERPLCGHVPLVLTNGPSPRFKWCRNKRQFKEVPSNTCLYDSDRRVSDPNDCGPRFNIHWGTNLLLHFLFLRG